MRGQIPGARRRSPVHQPDAVDYVCEAWAYQWVQLFGNSPARASQYLGRVASTLGLPFAGSGSAVQTFPEGFLGDGLLVANAMEYMREAHREFLYRHYIDRWYYVRRIAQPGIFEHTTLQAIVDERSKEPLEVYVVDRTRPTERAVIERRSKPMKQQVMAQRMGISRAEYHHRRDAAKAYVAGLIDSGKCLDTKVGAHAPG